MNDASIKSADVTLTFETHIAEAIINKGYVFSLGIPISGYAKKSTTYFPSWLGFIYCKSEYIIYCFGPKTMNGSGEFTNYPILTKTAATIFYI